MKNPYNHYQSIELEQRVESASPHQLIDMLLQGARSHIAKAQGHIQRQQTPEKCEHIGKAISIVEGLKTSLDYDQGGEIAVNLSQLYDHVHLLLVSANRHNNEDLLAQSNLILSEVHDAWQAIKP